MTSITRYLQHASALVFVLVYFILVFYWRLTSDDYHFLLLAQQGSVIEGVVSEYTSWCSRYLSIGVLLAFLKLELAAGVGLWAFGYISLMVWLTGLHRLMSALSAHYLSATWPVRLSTLINVMALLMLSTYNIGETWWYIGASSMYLWSGVALVHLSASLIGGRSRWSDSIISVLAGFYIGATSGPLSLVLLTAFVSWWLLSMGRRTAAPPRLAVYAAVAMGVAFALLYLAPANEIRSSAFRDITVLSAIGLNVKMTGIIGLNRLPFIFLPILLLAYPLATLFKWPQRFSSFEPSHLLALMSIGYISIVFLLQLPVTYKTLDITADRGLFPLTLLSVVVAVGVMTIFQSLISRRSSAMIAMGSAAILLIAVCALLWSALTIERPYAIAHDERLTELTSEGEDMRVLAPLPRTRLYKSAEISTDSIHYHNQFLRQVYGLRHSPVRGEE